MFCINDHLQNVNTAVAMHNDDMCTIPHIHEHKDTPTSHSVTRVVMYMYDKLKCAP